jgi:CRP-like cAMP-binding protein
MVHTTLDIHLPTLMQTPQSLWDHKKSTILQQLSKDDLAALEAHTIRMALEPKQSWYFQEAENSCVYILDRGYARRCRLLPSEERRVILGFLRPADIFGDFPGATSFNSENDYIEAAEAIHLIAIESEVFWDVLKKHPNFMMRLIEILTQQQERLQKRVLSASIKDVYARVAEVLLDVSEKLDESQALKGSYERYVALTHQEISDLSGIARPTVSKTISEMLRAGILSKQERHLGLNHIPNLMAVTDHGCQALSSPHKIKNAGSS